MPPLPMEQTGESPTAGGGVGGGVDTQRSLPTPFLTKTYHLVDDPSVDELISWNDDGSTFVVWRPAEFARDLLPKYFKHNNFSSFVRQLNTYGFRKVVPDRWEFANDCFKKGEKPLLRDIQRRKISHALAAAVVAPAVTAAAVPVPTCTVSPTNSGDDQVISTNVTPTAKVAPGLRRTTSCTTAPEIVETVAMGLRRTTSCTTTPGILEENERLRKENVQMNQELTQLRGLYTNIFALVNNYNTNQVDCSNTSNNHNNNNNLAEGRPLDLMPAAHVLETVTAEEMAMSGGPRVGTTLVLGEEETSPRLFGVSIGAKRVRREEEEEEEEDDEMQGSDQVESQENEQQMSDMKSEPLDGSSSERPDHDDSRWLELGK